MKNIFKGLGLGFVALALVVVGASQASAVVTLTNLAVNTAAGDAFVLGAANTTGSITIGSATHTGSTTLSSGTVTGTTTTSAFPILADAVTTGTALYMTADALTTGEGILVDHTTTVIADGGSLARLSSTSIDTGTTTGNLLDLSSTASTAGTQILGTFSGLTTGIGQSVVVDALTTGTALNLNNTSGVMTTNGEMLNVSAAAATTSTGLVRITGAALTTGAALQVTTAGAAMLTTGEAIDVVLGANTVGAGITITGTGTYTGVGAADGYLNIVGNGLTTGHAAKISTTAITTGTGLLITGSAVTTMTNAGSYLRFSDGTTDVFRVGTNGHLISASADVAGGEPALTVSGGFTATAETGGNGVGTATDSRGRVSFTSDGNAGTAILTFGTAYATAPVCVISPADAEAQANVDFAFVTTSATAMTINYITGTAVTADLWNYICME